MITKDLSGTLYSTKIVPLHAILSKNQHTFAGYGFLNIPRDTILSVSLNKPDIISNEKLLGQVLNTAGFKPEWCYYDDVNFYYYIPTPRTLLWDSVQIYLEVINSYNGHTRRQVNWVLKIGEHYFFTDWKAMDWENGELKWLVKLSNVNYMNYYFSERSHYMGGIAYAIPNKFNTLIPELEKFALAETKLDYVKLYLPLINKWMQTSFLEAHKFSVKLFNKIQG